MVEQNRKVVERSRNHREYRETEMNVPKGFKQTEVGVIPDDWEVAELGQLANFLDELRKPIKSSDREKMKGAYPYYGASGIIDYVNNYIFDDELILLGEDGENILSRNLRLAFIVRGKVWVNNHAHVLKAKEGCSTAFLAEKLESLNYDQYNSGTAQPKLNKRTCSKIKFPIPPTKTEQTAIATALSDMDALIEGVEKLLEKKRRIKQGAMQELLKPKKGWVCHPIKSFTDATAGGTPSTEIDRYWNGNIRWMNSGELHLKRINEVEGRITESGLKNSSTRLLPKYCVLIGLAGQGRTRGTVAINQVELCTNQSIAAIFPNDSFVPDYLYYNLDIRYSELRKLSTGDGGRGGLNLTLIRAVEIPFPPTIDEQRQIVHIFNDMDKEIEKLKTQRTKYQQLKTGMMQELLTGKKRLV